VFVILVAAVGFGFSLFGLTSLPWTTTIPASFLVGAAGLLGDLLAFDAPIARGERFRNASLAAATTIAAVACLAVTYEAGVNTRSRPHTYLYLVTNHDGFLTFGHSVPLADAGNSSEFESGQVVHVECAVTVAGVRWFRLDGDAGWLSQREAVPEPYTGQGNPPTCPG
jgi:hypothetical protein